MVSLSPVPGTPHEWPPEVMQEDWWHLILLIISFLVLGGTALSFYRFEAVRLAIGSGGLVVISMATVPAAGVVMALVKTVFWYHNRKSREKGRS